MGTDINGSQLKQKQKNYLPIDNLYDPNLTMFVPLYLVLHNAYI